VKKIYLAAIIGALSFLGAYAFPQTVEAKNCGGVVTCDCGDTVTSNYTATSSLSCPLVGGYPRGLTTGANNIVIDGAGYSIVAAQRPTNDVLSSTSGGINIGHTGVTVKNYTVSGYATGIRVSANFATVQDNTLTDNPGHGIHVNSKHGSTITGNTITGGSGIIATGNNGSGIFIANTSSWITVTNNTVNNNLRGIEVAAAATSSSFSGNQVSGNRNGNYVLPTTAMSSTSYTTNTFATSNFSDGYPIYVLNGVNGQTYDGASLGTLGLFYCNNCTNVTLQNAAFSPNARYPVFISNSTSTVIQNSTIGGVGGLLLFQATSTVVSGNVFQNVAVGDGAGFFSAVVYKSDSSTITNNVFRNVYGWLKLDRGSGTNTISGNTIGAVYDPSVVLYNDGNGTNVFSNNTFAYLIGRASKMLQFTDTDRTYEVGDTINFTADMYDLTGTGSTGASCASCTYTAVAYPTETVSANQVGNRITGSFSPSKAGLYSLVVSVADSSGNTTKGNLHYFVGTTTSKTFTSYFRNMASTRGGILGNGLDAQVMSNVAPSSSDVWWCSGWTQSSLENTPSYPFAYLTNMAGVLYYKHVSPDGGVFGIQRTGNYSAPYTTDINTFLSVIDPLGIDSYVSAPSSSSYTSVSNDFSNLEWTMDSVFDWYKVTAKLGTNTDSGSGFAYTTSSSTAPSYINYTLATPTAAPIYSTSNLNIKVLSSSAPANATTTAEVVVHNPETAATSTTIALSNIRRPFLNANTSTIEAGATTTVAVEVAADTVSTLTAIPMDITPSTGSVDVVVNAWNDTERMWTESSESHSANTDHSISGLTSSTEYFLAIDGAATTTYATDANGVLAFTYEGGFSSHSFNLFTDSTPPAVAVTAPVADATVARTVTFTASATDSGSVLGVQFKLDGSVLVGDEDTSAPYEISWESTSVADGLHTITAVARDDAGNYATSSSVSVRVTNSGSRSSGYSSTRVSGVIATLPTSTSIATSTAPVSPSTASTCRRLQGYIKQGQANDPTQVKLLQEFLRTHQQESLVSVTGVYDIPTVEAVKRFQLKYADSVLKPWGMVVPSGYVYTTTSAKVNELMCGTNNTTPAVATTTSMFISYSFTAPLSLGMTSDAVTKLQQLLARFPELYPEGKVTGYFGPLTKRAVERLQTKYQLAAPGDDMYGFVGPKTRERLNILLKERE